jgi:aerobic-type carbon monoxide dehydrogenase small subunit (CoxS/CutS family)
MSGEYSTGTFRINGDEVTVAFLVQHTLLEVLREECRLTGTKHGCELGECGTCTVLIDGVPVLSCLVLAVEATGKEIQTVEGLSSNDVLHPLQDRFAEMGAAQCGYCTPGILMAAKSLLEANPNPTRPEVQEALSGNLCRCTGYIKILEAVELAAADLRGESNARPSDASLYGVRADDGSRT